jgi:hypothetical protein
MAFTKTQLEEIKTGMSHFLARRRPPPEIRDKVDIQYHIRGQSVEILEVRPRRDGSEKQIVQPVAKTTYVRTQNVWKIYWMRADLKWHGYTPQGQTDSFAEFTEIVEEDDFACFFG